MAEPTLYDFLGVPSDADREAIRRAYIVIAKRSHPDRSVDDPVRRAAAAEQIRRANQAWNVLGDGTRRAQYDAALRDAAGEPPSRSARTTASDGDHSRNAVPSGIVIDERLAPIWRWGPAVVIVAIGLLILIVSAYATSNSASTSTVTTVSAPRPVVGDCVLLVPSDIGTTAFVADCAGTNSGKVASIIETPRPCPTGTENVALEDHRTTLCLTRTR